MTELTNYLRKGCDGLEPANDAMEEAADEIDRLRADMTRAGSVRADALREAMQIAERQVEWHKATVLSYQGDDIAEAIYGACIAEAKFIASAIQFLIDAEGSK